MRPRRSALLVAGVVLAGCGGGSTSSPTATPSATSETIGFCAVYRSELITIENAGTNALAAVAAYDRIARVVPAEIADDVHYVADALHGYVERNVSGDPAKVQRASTTITRYYAAHCG